MAFRRMCAATAAGFTTGGAVHFATKTLPRVMCDNKADDSSNGSTARRETWQKTWGLKWVKDWDSPTARGAPTEGVKGVRRQLILIRHGQYENEGCDDDSVRRLTKLGEEQALATGKYLRTILQDSALVPVSDIHAIYTSDLQRAKQTAELIKTGLEQAGKENKKKVTPASSEVGKIPKLTVDSGLREIFPCDPEPPYVHAKAKPQDEKTIEQTFAKYFHRPLTKESSTEIVVGHGNVIRYCVCRALQIPPEAWLRFTLPHCSLTVVSINSTGYVSVQQVGSVGHLLPREQTVLNVK